MYQVEPTSITRRNTANSVTLQWLSWQGSRQPDHQLVYQMEYSSFIKTSNKESWSEWISTTPINHRDGPYQIGVVDSLVLNTFYKFRVLPIIIIEKEQIAGTYSTTSRVIRTNCTGIN